MLRKTFNNSFEKLGTTDSSIFSFTLNHEPHVWDVQHAYIDMGTNMIVCGHLTYTTTVQASAYFPKNS